MMSTTLSQQIAQEIKINKTQFVKGNQSIHGIIRGKFVKLWRAPAPGHDCIISRIYKGLSMQGVVPKLIEEGDLPYQFHFGGYEYNYAYVYESVPYQHLDYDQINSRILTDPFLWCKELYLFFRSLEECGFAYVDFAWKNLGVRSDGHYPIVFFDVDSAMSIREDYPANRVDMTYHNMYIWLSKTRDLRHFNLACFSELCIITVLAYAAQDANYLMNSQVLGIKNHIYENTNIDLTPFGLTDPQAKIVKKSLQNIINLNRGVFAGRANREQDAMLAVWRQIESTINELNHLGTQQKTSGRSRSILYKKQSLLPKFSLGLWIVSMALSFVISAILWNSLGANMLPPFLSAIMLTGIIVSIIQGLNLKSWVSVYLWVLISIIGWTVSAWSLGTKVSPLWGAGIPIALVQWLILRTRFKKSALWLPFTIFAFGISFSHAINNMIAQLISFNFVFAQYVIAGIDGLVFGFTTGVAFLMIVRKNSS